VNITMAVSFVAYIEGVRSNNTKNGVIKLPMATEIKERWNSRVITRKLHDQGVTGAELYLRDYGRGISAKKCEALALYAESEGAKNFALGFWAKGLELSFGCRPSIEELAKLTGKNGNGSHSHAKESPSTASEMKLENPGFESLPKHLIPGKVVTMQPVDAPRDVEEYLRDPAFLAQPKRDGNRMVIAVDVDGSALAQKRSGNIEPVSPAWQSAFREMAKKHGPFVLDGERYFQDVFGKEHRTGSQAATANKNGGQPDGEVLERYAVFKALFVGGRDLTGEPEIRRLEIGAFLAHELEEIDTRSFESLPTCSTLPAKQDLLEQQKAEGREGIILVRNDCRYTGGKTNGKDAPFVRYKFTQTVDVFITGLTKTAVAGRAFGAIEVAAYCNGELTPLGSVGTGFTQVQANHLADLHAAHPGRVVIEITTQGFTEGGKVWHARFMEVRTDKKPEDCEVLI
jgi:ATP-dependent DNA ligase